MRRWPSQLELLNALGRHPHVTCGELAKAGAVPDASNALHALRRLARVGLVVEDPDPAGARWSLSASAATWIGRDPASGDSWAVVHAQRLALVARHEVAALAAALEDPDLRREIAWVSETEHAELGAFVGLRHARLPSEAAQVAEAFRWRGVVVQDVLLHDPRVGDDEIAAWAKKGAPGSERSLPESPARPS